jgi:cytochrome-b5 reductase
MEGPNGKLTYEGHGNFDIRKKKVTGKTKIGHVAGGTGITPCYQVIQAGLKNNDGTTHSLIFGNRSVSDILLKDEL